MVRVFLTVMVRVFLTVMVRVFLTVMVRVLTFKPYSFISLLSPSPNFRNIYKTQCFTHTLLMTKGRGKTLYLTAPFCNAGEEILKTKFNTAVEAIKSGVVDETKAICKVITIDCQ